VKLYKVGGCVRDQLLGISSKDIDYSVEAKSYAEMREELLARGCKIYLEKPEYLTIRGKLNNEDVDFVLCRKDGAYSDGRRPDEVTIGTIYDDLARRDFTINAIAIDEDGNYIDPFNGRKDLEDRIIRCVGSNDRLKEDALRILRAYRFCITKGFDLEESIKEEVFEYWSLLDNISEERITQELNKCFESSVEHTMYTIAVRHEFFGRYLFEMCDRRGIKFNTKFYPDQAKKTF
jgi:tRNA nucleotidyltransferase (CCA-adding enzyme)